MDAGYFFLPEETAEFHKGTIFYFDDTCDLFIGLDKKGRIQRLDVDAELGLVNIKELPVDSELYLFSDSGMSCGYPGCKIEFESFDSMYIKVRVYDGMVHNGQPYTIQWVDEDNVRVIL